MSAGIFEYIAKCRSCERKEIFFFMIPAACPLSPEVIFENFIFKHLSVAIVLTCKRCKCDNVHDLISFNKNNLHDKSKSVKYNGKVYDGESVKKAP